MRVSNRTLWIGMSSRNTPGPESQLVFPRYFSYTKKYEKPCRSLVPFVCRADFKDLWKLRLNGNLVTIAHTVDTFSVETLP